MAAYAVADDAVHTAIKPWSKAARLQSKLFDLDAVLAFFATFQDHLLLAKDEQIMIFFTFEFIF